MNIVIFGYSGFIGSHVANVLKNEHTIIKISARNIKFNSSQKQIFDYFEKIIIKPDLIINFCANTKPKSKNDFFINENLSKIIQKFIELKKLNTHFLHISTINVLINERLDKYTISKKNAERGLENSFTSIVRLPLIVNFDNGKKGDLEIFYNYLNLKFIPIYPMIYPGNIYRPIEISNLCKFFLEIVNNKKKNKIYNLMGKKEHCIWDLFDRVAKIYNKKTFKIKTSALKKVLPNSLKEKFFKKSSFFGQLLSVDQSNIDLENIIYL